MDEEQLHWKTVINCNLCGQPPADNLYYRCPLLHQFCPDCHADLRSSYEGETENAAICTICKVSGVFTEYQMSASFLSKIKARPGIGRPYRYRAEEYASKSSLDFLSGSVQDFSSSSSTTSYSPRSSRSKVPIKCPHIGCHIAVAPSAFLTHYKYEHSAIPIYKAERGKEICLPCDISVVRFKKSLCLAIICLYEVDEETKKLEHSNSFWLMATGSPERREENSSVIFWLFCPTADPNQVTIELSSALDTMAFCTCCGVHVLGQQLGFKDITNCLTCLLITRDSVVALLSEGPQLNLKVTIH